MMLRAKTYPGRDINSEHNPCSRNEQQIDTQLSMMTTTTTHDKAIEINIE